MKEGVGGVGSLSTHHGLARGPFVLQTTTSIADLLTITTSQPPYVLGFVARMALGSLDSCYVRQSEHVISASLWTGVLISKTLCTFAGDKRSLNRKIDQ